MEAKTELISVKEAREILGASGHRMAYLIERGILATEPDLFDGRRKLIKRSDVLALAKKAGRIPKAAKVA